MNVFRKELLCGLLLLTVIGSQAAEIPISLESDVSLMERAAAAVFSTEIPISLESDASLMQRAAAAVFSISRWIVPQPHQYDAVERELMEFWGITDNDLATNVEARRRLALLLELKAWEKDYYRDDERCLSRCASASQELEAVLDPTLEKRIQDISQSLGRAVQADSALPNLLFCGPLHQHKMRVARRIAQSSGLHFIYCPATVFTDCPIDEAAAKLYDLFILAESCPKKVMICFERAEVLLENNSANLKACALTIQWLIKSGASSNNYMKVLLTGFPETLNQQVRRSCSESLGFVGANRSETY